MQSLGFAAVDRPSRPKEQKMPSEFQRYRVLWPLVPAMAMVMIDFTIVSISASTIQSDLHLSETAVQWLVTAYALSTAAFVALGGGPGGIFWGPRVGPRGGGVLALRAP